MSSRHKGRDRTRAASTTLETQFFWESQRKGRSRFNLLLLEYGEYFFEDLSANCYVLGETSALLPGHALEIDETLKVPGRLKVCSRCVIFEPNDTKRAVIKYPYKNLTSSVESVNTKWTQSSMSTTNKNCDSDMSLTFLVNSYFEMKANNVVGPYKLSEVKRRVVISLVHSDLVETVRKIDRLRQIYSNTENEGSSAAEQYLVPFVEAASSCAFDFSQLADFHENLLLKEAVSVKRIKPLITNPGLFMVTETRVYFQPSQLNNVGDTVQCIDLNKVLRIYCRRYLLRQTGLEFLLHDGSSTLYIFESRALRDKIYKILISANIEIENNKLPKAQSSSSPRGYTFGQSQTVDSITRSWQNRDISNFEYLMQLNNEADRSVNDLTQYPVFPHILADYDSDKLDLDDPNTFRDLSKPVGALNERRLDDFKERFENMPEEDFDIGLPPPFLYGTHYSTPGYVLHYLVRVAPEFMLCLQNGKFDTSDRMFHSIPDTWDSCMNNPTDLKELIPEFFCGSGEFLNNSEDLDLGRRQTGDRVDNVDLPAWAKRPHDFIRKNKKALESEYVSENLHQWIDLIFGYKQKGEEAIKADNLYYYLTYEGSVDLEQEKDARMRAALEIQIQEFGQCPKQLFAGPHPCRNAVIDDESIQLCQGINPNTVIEQAVQGELKIAATYLAEEERGDKDSEKDEILQLGDDFKEEVIRALSEDQNISAISALIKKKEESSNSPKNKNGMKGMLNHWTGKTASFIDKTVTAIIGDGEEEVQQQQRKLDIPTSDSNLTLPSPPVETTKMGFKSSTQNFTGIISLQSNDLYHAHMDCISGIGMMCNNGTSTLCTVSRDCSLKVMQLAEKDLSLVPKRSFGLENDVSSCSVTADAKHILFSSSDTLFTYNVVKGCATGKTVIHDDVITSIFLRQGDLSSLLVTGASDGSVKLWNLMASSYTLQNDRPLAELLNYDSPINCVTINENGSLVAVGGLEDNTVVIIDVLTQKVLMSHHVTSQGTIVNLDFVQNEKLVFCTSSGLVVVIDTSASAIQTHNMGFSAVVSSTKTDIDVTAMQTSSDKRVVFLGCRDGSIRLLDINTPIFASMRELYRSSRAHECPITSITLGCSATEEYVASGGADGSVRVLKAIFK